MQCCVSLCRIAEWVSYTYIHSFLDSSHPHHHRVPSKVPYAMQPELLWYHCSPVCGSSARQLFGGVIPHMVPLGSAVPPRSLVPPITRPSRTNTKKIYIYIYPFHHRGLECRSRKARNTRNNRHFGLGVQNEGGQRLTELCQENTLVTTNTLSQKHKRQLYTWTSPDGQYQNQIDYILCSQRWRSSTQPAKTRPGADCGSDHTLLTRKFRLKLKKVGKTTRPFKYDLNHIPYDYTMEVTNRFKRLDLRDRVPEEL